MYDIYRLNKEEINKTDFNGSGVGNGHYSKREDRKERLREITFPAILLLVCTFCLCVLISLTVTEVDLYKNGKTLTIHMNANGRTGTYVDPKTNIGYTIDVSPVYQRNADNDVIAYYKGDDIYEAQPLTKPFLAVIAYVVFVGLFGLIIFWITRILHHSHHSRTQGIDDTSPH